MTFLSNSNWKDDDKFKKATTKLVQQGLQRIEVPGDFDIFYNDQSVEVEDLKLRKDSGRK